MRMLKSALLLDEGRVLVDNLYRDILIVSPCFIMSIPYSPYHVNLIVHFDLAVRRYTLLLQSGRN